MSLHSLPRSTPRAEGISSVGLLGFVHALEAANLETHSVMVARHGKVVMEGWWRPYAADRRHMLYSLSKSFTSTAIGIACGEGLLSLDDKVISFFPEDLPETISENLAAMRVRDLLSMSCGQDADDLMRLPTDPIVSWVELFLARPVPYEPGTFFFYNSTATYMLSAILQKITGITLIEYLGPRLYEPLGIEGTTWDTCPHGVSVGGWGMTATTETIAKFSLLYLQDGVWEGKRLLPEEWVANATSVHVSNGTDPASDWAQGYGFQFWRSKMGAFRGDGAFGQFGIVLPDLDAVVAITGGGGDMQATLNVVWQHLVPAIGQADSEQDDAAVAAKLALLELEPHGDSSPRPLSGAYVKTAGDSDFTSLAFAAQDGGIAVTLTNDLGDHAFVAGLTDWVPGSLSLNQLGGSETCAKACWLGEHTLVIKVCWVGGPDARVFRCQFVGDKVEVTITRKGSFFDLGDVTFSGLRQTS